MILQALNEYYQRKAADPDSGIAPQGFELKEIPYVLRLAPDGTPVTLASTYEGDGKKRRAKKYLIPQAVERSAEIASNLLWDNPEYIFGVVLKENPDRVEKQHTAFIDRVAGLDAQGDAGLESVRRFLALEDKTATLSGFECWKELCDAGANVTFGLANEPGVIVERPAVRRAIEQNAAGQEGKTETVCLVSGETAPVERLHAAIKGVYGARSPKPKIVSFNLEAFRSFGKEKGENAPVGKPAAFAYTTALNTLLGRDSLQRIQVGDASTVFWSQKESTLETQVVNIFSEPPRDDPDKGTKAVRALYDSVKTGVLTEAESNNPFYVLGLAPNASRIAIRFWIVGTVAEMSGKILQHFEDLSIVHGPRDRDALSLFRLLISIAVQGKSENIPPNLAGETMRAILEGLPYPRTLLQAAVRRNRAEQSVTYARAALIKACLNRQRRFDALNKDMNENDLEKELTMGLDLENENIGYRLGRLFATLEKIQSEAHPGINATIRDRYYGAASSTPVAVFGNLMRLKNHHLAKLENAGRRVNFERLLTEIHGGIDDYPTHLALADQGRFAIGYYHQMQSFYTKKGKPGADVQEETAAGS